MGRHSKQDTSSDSFKKYQTKYKDRKSRNNKKSIVLVEKLVHFITKNDTLIYKGDTHISPQKHKTLLLDWMLKTLFDKDNELQIKKKDILKEKSTLLKEL